MSDIDCLRMFHLLVDWQLGGAPVARPPEFKPSVSWPWNDRRPLASQNTMQTLRLIAAILAGSLSGQGADYAGWAVGGRAEGHGTILHTTNSGSAWERQGTSTIADADMVGVCALSPLSAWVVGHAADGYSTLYHTSDGGQSWARLGSTNCLPNADLSKVRACDEQRVWAVGLGVILHTSDGGHTWTNLVPAGFAGALFQGIASPDDVNVWATGEALDGHAAVLKSTDAGRTWTAQGGSFPRPVGHVLGVAALDANEVRVLSPNNVWVAHDSTIRWTRDGGHTWSSFNSGEYTMDVSVADDTNVWAVAQVRQGLIYHTCDAGQNWQQQGVAGWTLPYLVAVAFVTPALPPPPGPTANYLSVQWAGTDLRLTGLGLPGTNYALEVAPALMPSASWTPTATNAAATNGVLTFTDTPSGAKRFYRTRELP